MKQIVKGSTAAVLLALALSACAQSPQSEERQAAAGVGVMQPSAAQALLSRPKGSESFDFQGNNNGKRTTEMTLTPLTNVEAMKIAT